MSDPDDAFNADMDGHRRISNASKYFVESDPDADLYHARLDQAMDQLIKSGFNEKRRFFFATTLVKINCAGKKHGRIGKTVARVYETTEGPVLVGNISNDLRDRRAPRVAEDMTSGETSRVRDLWFGLRPWHETYQGLEMQPMLRAAALLNWPDVDEFLFGREEWEQTERRDGVLLCECGRRTLPPLSGLLDLATEAQRLRTPGAVKI